MVGKGISTHCIRLANGRLAPSDDAMNTPPPRFWDKVDKTDSCWVWTGIKNSLGYGLFTIGSKKLLAHRYLYQRLVGPIPEGLQLDHLCRNKACVNPSHLEPVTASENIRRAIPFKRNYRGVSASLSATHCAHGHQLTEANTYMRPSGARECKTCRRAHRDKFRRKAG